MPSESTVVIAPPDLLPRLMERLRSHDGGELTSCPDTDIPAAIDRVLAIKPDRVALERLFAATSRGAALLSRLKADPALAHAEFRIVSHDSDYWRVSPRRPTPADAMAPAASHAVTSDAPAARSARHAPRRARWRFRTASKCWWMAAPLGWWICRRSAARSCRPVCSSPTSGCASRWSTGASRCAVRRRSSGRAFELSRGDLGPRYRAGLEFSGADADGVAEYARRHQKK